MPEETGDLRKVATNWRQRSRDVKPSPFGKEEDSETSCERVLLLVPQSTRLVSGRRLHWLRMLVDHLMSRREVGRFALREKSCGNRPILALPILQPLLSPKSSATPLLAVVMDRWPSFSRFGSRKLARCHRCLNGWRSLTPARTRRAIQACACLGRHRSTAHTSKSHVGFPHVSIGGSGTEKNSWLVAIAAFETGVSTKTGVRDGIGLHGPALVQ